MQFIESKEITAVLLSGSEKFNIYMHVNFYEPTDLEFCMMIDTVKPNVLITSLNDFDSDARSQECEKAKTPAPIFLQSSQLI